ncbi:MAG: HAD-IA family hydrolase [Desulfopila sp.]
MPDINPPIRPAFSWETIDTVLLDLDGTLLDSYFDDFFWEEYVPQAYARARGLSQQEARQRLLVRYRQVEKTLQWSDVDYWSEQLGLDIPELKGTIDHLIQVRPQVIDFLEFISALGKTVHLVTNAHAKTLAIKLGKTAIRPYFQRIVPAHEVGGAKEQPMFWAALATMLDFDRQRTMLVDDNSEVLRAAKDYGLAELIHIAKPSSRRPARFSTRFPSIVAFEELIFQGSSRQCQANPP